MKLGVIGLALSLAGCGWTTQQAVQAGVATLETAICIEQTFSKDKAAHKSDADAIADCVDICHTDAATVARKLDSTKAAASRMSMCAQ